MATAYSEIARVLDGARRRQGRVVLGTAVGAGVAGALAVLLLGAILLGNGLGPPAGVRWGALALASLAVVAAFAWAAVEVMRRASTHVAVARSVGERAPHLKSDLLSSVELEEESADPAGAERYSAALVEAHVAHTAGRARGLDLSAVVPSLPFRRAAVVLGLAVAANLVALAVAPRVVKAGWSGLLGAVGAAPVRRTEPITGDIELTYVYPAYMRRAPKTLSGTGGEISAPKGTEVQLATRADRKVESAEIAIESGGFAGGAADPLPPPGVARTGAPSDPLPPSGGGRDGERGRTAQPPAAGAQDSLPPPGGGRVGERGSSAAHTPSVPRKIYQLEVKDGRALSGRFVVEDGGSYRFRFTRGKKLLAEGPPLAIVVEPDAFPEVRITAPAQEIEVDAAARVRVEWTASDDVGLGDLALVTKPPEGEERRTPLRSLDGLKRESGVVDLELAPYRLAEGEKLLYWLEVSDEDTVSGPKKAASATQTVKVYSEAEHRRAALAKAQQLWEEMVRLLGDRLEFLDGAPRWTEERLAQAGQLDARGRGLHEALRTASQELRKDRSVPRELWQALANVAADVRGAEANVTSLRLQLQRMLRFQGPNSPLVRRMAEVDGDLDRALENGVLYLEQLFDKQRADDLVRMAKDLASRRRDLANLLEKYKQAPSEEKKKELLAEVQRLKARMQDMMRRMAELAKGLQDEHMNQEALQELARGKDAMSGLDEIEKMLAKGDVDGAMKALDQLGNQMQDMLASLERNAGTPGKQNAELMKDMLAFKKSLEDVQAEQEEVARQTEAVKGDYKKALSERMKSLDAQAKKLEGMAGQAREELKKAEKGVTLRSEEDYAQARDRLADLEKALKGKDFDAALETARRSMAPMQRLAMGLEDEAAIADRYRQLRQKDPADVRDAQRHAQAALGPARKVRDELERMFPDPRSVLGEGQQQKLGQLAKRQGELERKAGELRQKLDELAKRAPVFPPQASETLQGSQGHMREAQGQLSMRNPQRGHGEQRLALDDLARFRRGLDEMAKKSQGGSAGGQGFPFPFGEEQGGREGDGMDPSQEKVEIPGAEAYKVPDEFRKDLLEAMKQGTPEPYQGEVQRYYEELVK